MLGSMSKITDVQDNDDCALLWRYVPNSESIAHEPKRCRLFKGGTVVPSGHWPLGWIYDIPICTLTLDRVPEPGSVGQYLSQD